MFIDQFNEYELAIIRKELREIQKLSKEAVNSETWEKIDELFDRKSYHDECIFPYRAVGDAISTLVDYTIDNFVYKKQGRAKKQIGWYRSQQVPKGKEEEYRQIVDEILDVVKKHRDYTKFPLEKPKD